MIAMQIVKEFIAQLSINSSYVYWTGCSITEVNRTSKDFSLEDWYSCKWLLRLIWGVFSLLNARLILEYFCKQSPCNYFSRHLRVSWQDSLRYYQRKIIKYNENKAFCCRMLGANHFNYWSLKFSLQMWCKLLHF